MNAVISKLLERDSFPVMPIMTHPGIELIGRRVIDAVTDGQVHSDAVLALRRTYSQSVASTTIMDLSVEAQAFGADIVFEDDSVPTVTGRMLCSAQDVEAIEVPPLDKGRLPEYLKAIRLSAFMLFRMASVSSQSSATRQNNFSTSLKVFPPPNHGAKNKKRRPPVSAGSGGCCNAHKGAKP